MKTKSLLFAALVTISFATTSCQREENILPNINHSVTGSSPIIDEIETLDDEPNEKPQRFPKTSNTQATSDSVIVAIMQINADNVK